MQKCYKVFSSSSSSNKTIKEQSKTENQCVINGVSLESQEVMENLKIRSLRFE